MTEDHTHHEELATTCRTGKLLAKHGQKHGEVDGAGSLGDHLLQEVIGHLVLAWQRSTKKHDPLLKLTKLVQDSTQILLVNEIIAIVVNQVECLEL